MCRLEKIGDLYDQGKKEGQGRAEVVHAMEGRNKTGANLLLLPYLIYSLFVSMPTAPKVLTPRKPFRPRFKSRKLAGRPTVFSHAAARRHNRRGQYKEDMDPW